jgi:hypothetical protein
MYDYVFGSKKYIEKYPEQFLLFVKHLLPRYCNSIPDSLAITIFREVKKIKSKKNIILETGCGASTLSFFLACYLNKTHFISYEINKGKIDLLKKIINQSMCKYLKVNLHTVWKPVVQSSLNKKNGIPALKKNVAFSYIDSDHNVKHIEKEILLIKEKIKNKSIFLFDDMNLQIVEKNSNLLETIKYKKTLKNFKIQKFQNNKNILKNHFISLLKQNFFNIYELDTYYRSNFKKDLYYSYYGIDYFYNHLSQFLFEKKLSLKRRNKLLKNRALLIKVISKDK